MLFTIVITILCAIFIYICFIKPTKDEHVLLTFCIKFNIIVILFVTIGSIIGYFLPTIQTVEEYKLCTIDGEYLSHKENPLKKDSLIVRYKINTGKDEIVKEEEINNFSVKKTDSTPTVKIHKTKLKKDWYRLFSYNFLRGNNTYVEFFVP